VIIMWGRYRQYIATIIIAILAALSTYYTTINGLKIELAGKAEETFVTTLDKRISNLENRLANNFATKEDFFKLREDLVSRLIRIESQLNQKEHAIEN
jgi:predicted Holliday junction resolvase-like endonuclease